MAHRLYHSSVNLHRYGTVWSLSCTTAQPHTGKVAFRRDQFIHGKANKLNVRQYADSYKDMKDTRIRTWSGCASNDRRLLKIWRRFTRNLEKSWKPRRSGAKIKLSHSVTHYGPGSRVDRWGQLNYRVPQKPRLGYQISLTWLDLHTILISWLPFRTISSHMFTCL